MKIKEKITKVLKSKPVTKIKKILNYIPKYIYILFFITLIIYYPAKVNSGVFGHDSAFHATNIFAMDRNTSLFELPPRIRPIIANDFGYGTGIFYPQFFHFSVFLICKIVKALNIPGVFLANCINIYLFLFTFVVAIVMRKLLYKYTSNSKISTIGSILYILYPYFIDDIYVRSAYGELIVFLSLPLIFLGLNYLFNENNKVKFYIFFILGFYLIFSSHVLSSLYTTIFTGIFILINIKKLFKNKNIIHLAVASIFAVLLSLNSLVPILEHSILGNYMAFESNYMSSISKVLSNVLSFDSLFIISVLIDAFIPMTLILLTVFLFLNYKKIIKKLDSNIIKGHLLIVIVACILVTFPYIWKILPEAFIKIQFPWRNCAYIGFSICVLATLGLLMIPKKYFKIVTISTLIISFITFTYIIYLSGNIIDRNIWVSNIPGMGVEKEYLPKNTYLNMDYFDTRDKDVHIVRGNAKTKILEDDTPYLKFKIDTKKETIVEIPRLYYLWYDINLLDKNNNKINLDFYENEVGFIEFKIPRSGVVTVEYKKTLLSSIADIISILSLLSLIIYLYILNKNKLTNKSKL